MKLHPEAKLDLKEGKAFYRRRSPLAALAFASEVDKAMKQIAEAPMRYQQGEHGTREFVLPWRFPYTIAYVIGETAVTIVAIAHQSREPGYWRHRV